VSGKSTRRTRTSPGRHRNNSVFDRNCKITLQYPSIAVDFQSIGSEREIVAKERAFAVNEILSVD
jgi:hypothetical protein